MELVDLRARRSAGQRPAELVHPKDLLIVVLPRRRGILLGRSDTKTQEGDTLPVLAKDEAAVAKFREVLDSPEEAS